MIIIKILEQAETVVKYALKINLTCSSPHIKIRFQGQTKII